MGYPSQQRVNRFYREGETSAGNAAGLSQDEMQKDNSYQERLSRLLDVFCCVRPVKSLKSVRQGDVIVSSSGNFRLVINSVTGTEPEDRLRFLTLSSGKILNTESVQLDRIDLKRLYAVVVRRGYDPIGKFSDIAANMGKEKVVLANIETLLMGGVLGSRIKEELKVARTEEVRPALRLMVSRENGKILGVSGNQNIQEPAMPINLLINVHEGEFPDYIEKIIFPAGASPEIKRIVVASGVYANTLQNAVNLISVMNKAGQEHN